MDAACVQQAVSEGKTLRAVVIAADQHNRCVRQGSGRMLCVCDFQNLMQNVVLIIQHGDLIDSLGEMQIRQMKKLHEIPPTNQRYHNCTGFPAKEQ